MNNYWQPSAPCLHLRRRAELLQQIRQFFLERQILEVETPLLCQYTVTDIHTTSFKVPINPESTETYYLQTSPEYAMKRLLAAGMGDIFQISKAFRFRELGRYHNSEFTMLEWYRIGYDHYQLMDEISCLLHQVAGIDSIKRLSYQTLFQKYCSLDIFKCHQDELTQAVTPYLEIDSLRQLDRNDCLNVLLTHVIEPRLRNEGAVFIYDFPASQSALAKICPNNPEVARRFELYLEGIEIANGFHELTDATEQAHRFEQDSRKRCELQLPDIKIDHRLLAALEHGLPECAGVALGIDRLMMHLTKAEKIDEVVSFAWNRA